MELGKTIQRIRSEKSISRKQLAEASNVSRSYLYSIEKGWKKPSIKTLEFISKALNVPTPMLVFYSITIEDVPTDKRQMYEILHPHMKLLVDKFLKYSS
jgi:transcriptional regulator with XRE-family HTH domain